MLKKYRVTSEAFIDGRLVHAGEVVEMEEDAAKGAAHLEPFEEPKKAKAETQKAAPKPSEDKAKPDTFTPKP